MKRLLSVLLALTITLCCLSCPALGAEARFSDVPQDAWFAQGVETCAQRGIMVGTGADAFSPDGVLSRAECLTLALRLYDMRQGGDGTFAVPDETWGRFALTTQDGTQASGYADTAIDRSNVDDARLFSWGSYRHNEFGYLSLNLTDDQVEWAKAQEGPATLTVSGETYSGTVTCWCPNNWVLSFHPDGGDDSEVGLVIRDTLFSNIPGPDKWWRSAYYHAAINGLDDPAAFPGLAQLRAYTPTYPASRQEFACALADAAGELPALRQVEDIPGVAESDPCEKAAHMLYEAGILTGTDEYGTFDGEGTLTRAQAAVMAARVLDPALRVQTALKLRQPEELVALAVRHSSFGQTEVVYTLDLTENTLTTLRPGYSWGAEETEPTEEVQALSPDKAEAFRRSQAVASLLGWDADHFNPNILDGHQWGITLTFSDGQSQSISGSNAYPEGWDQLYLALEDLTGQNILSVTSDWLEP